MTSTQKLGVLLAAIAAAVVFLLSVPVQAQDSEYGVRLGLGFHSDGRNLRNNVGDKTGINGEIGANLDRFYVGSRIWGDDGQKARFQFGASFRLLEIGEHKFALGAGFFDNGRVSWMSTDRRDGGFGSVDYWFKGLSASARVGNHEYVNISGAYTVWQKGGIGVQATYDYFHQEPTGWKFNRENTHLIGARLIFDSRYSK